MQFAQTTKYIGNFLHYFETETIDINCDNENIILKYKWQDYSTSIEELWLKAEKLVDAKYFIKPIMWKEWQ